MSEEYPKHLSNSLTLEKSLVIPGLDPRPSKVSLLGLSKSLTGQNHRALVCSKKYYHVINIGETESDCQVKRTDRDKIRDTKNLGPDSPSLVKFCPSEKFGNIFALLFSQDSIEVSKIRDDLTVVPVLHDRPISHRRYVTDIDWSISENPKLASTSMDSDLKIWRFEQGGIKTNHKIMFHKNFNLVGYSQLVKWLPTRVKDKGDGELIATTMANGSRVQIWDLRAPKKPPIQAFSLTEKGYSNYQARAIDFDFEDRYMMVLANSSNSNPEHSSRSIIKVFDRRLVGSDKEFFTKDIPYSTDAKFSPDGKFIFTVSGDRSSERTVSGGSNQSGVGSTRISRDASRTLKIIKIKNDPDDQGTWNDNIREYGSSIQHWECRNGSKNDKSYFMTTVIKKETNIEINQKNKTFDFILNKEIFHMFFFSKVDLEMYLYLCMYLYMYIFRIIT